MELSYKQVGEYQYPQIQLKDTDRTPLGRWGRMRRSYLEEHDPLLYQQLAMREELFPHLREIDATAQRRMEELMVRLLEQNPAPDKQSHQMAWVQHMNSLRAQAEELIQTELIYN